MPKVSICVPNLNTRPYLPVRFETIFNQTFQDWELIVYDSYSNDGAWEYIQELAARDPRMRISQGPREGIYLGWNACIRQARGEYIYIATSDDTMMPDCLEKMVAALDANPDCGLCQCQLVIIDEHGVPFPSAQQWNHFSLGAYDRNLVAKRNKRMAPHDGIVHPALFTIYTSITQLLIRRSVFDRIGLFDSRWSSVSDFEWEMRAGLVENCIYIPDKLATWRKHASQATADINNAATRLKMIEMTRAAFARARQCSAGLLVHINIEEFVAILERDLMVYEYASAIGGRARLWFLFRQLLRRPAILIPLIGLRLHGHYWSWQCDARHELLRRLLQKFDVPSPIYD